MPRIRHLSHGAASLLATLSLASSLLAQQSSSTQLVQIVNVDAGTSIGTNLPPLATAAPSPAEPKIKTYDNAWDASAAPDTSRARGSFPARLVNLSVRANVAGADALIAGAAIKGTAALPTLVRAIGPGLAQFGLANVVLTPAIAIYSNNRLVAETNTPSPSADVVGSYVGAFPLTTLSGASAIGDVALYGRAAAGVLTANCSSERSSGTGLVEFYDSDPAAAPSSTHFINFSARASVTTSEGLIVGFVVAGEGKIRLLLRGIGPTLTQFGVTNALADPTIDLYGGSNRIASNDDWQRADSSVVATVRDAAKGAGAFPLENTAEAAMIVSVPAGAYTLVVRGVVKFYPTPVNAIAGVALGEIYDLGPAEN